MACLCFNFLWCWMYAFIDNSDLWCRMYAFLDNNRFLWWVNALLDNNSCRCWWMYTLFHDNPFHRWRVCAPFHQNRFVNSFRCRLYALPDNDFFRCRMHTLFNLNDVWWYIRFIGFTLGCVRKRYLEATSNWLGNTRVVVAVPGMAWVAFAAAPVMVFTARSILADQAHWFWYHGVIAAGWGWPGSWSGGNHVFLDREISLARCVVRITDNRGAWPYHWLCNFSYFLWLRFSFLRISPCHTVSFHPNLIHLWWRASRSSFTLMTSDRSLTFCRLDYISLLLLRYIRQLLFR